ncbi:PDR/VanB family oxidoreductase [Methylibium sp. Root1272]|uniref:PDR/VanB family oxidoreductase n=1 Tax=Methylibium sp. Root1272 TaxID=1736441 RepID=UPI0009E9C512|nr:PDR/VanB family oxidoreductase [Methylibium sp. Root1272]
MKKAWIDVRVARRTTEAINIISLELVPVGNSMLPPSSAGSHIDVELPNGLIRQYSLCNDSVGTNSYRIAVLLDASTRGGSESVHRDLAIGCTFRISEPRNHFPLVPARRSILFAGGIGVTPILSMMERLSASGADFVVHYCARSRDHAAFVEYIRDSISSDRVIFHFDDESPEQKLDANLILARPSEDVHVYVCGPQGFMDHVIGVARANGWAKESVHFEYFSGKDYSLALNGGFDVKIASTGLVIPVAAEQSIIDALLKHGIEVPVSCEQGVCGTCVTRVLDGVPDHRDMYFSDDERQKGGQITPCCSRSLSAMLVLDL